MSFLLLILNLERRIRYC